MQFVRGFFVFNERITIYRFLSIFFWNLIFNEEKKNLLHTNKIKEI